MDASDSSSSSGKSSPSISREILQKLALLSRLPDVPTGTVQDRLLGELNAVVGLFEALQSQDLSAFEPLQEAPGVERVRSDREDQVIASEPDLLLTGAPELEGRGFVVPSVMGS